MNLSSEKLVSKFAFKFTLYRYTAASTEATDVARVEAESAKAAAEAALNLDMRRWDAEVAAARASSEKAAAAALAEEEGKVANVRNSAEASAAVSLARAEAAATAAAASAAAAEAGQYKLKCS